MSTSYNIADLHSFNKNFNAMNIKTILQSYTDMISEFLQCIVENIHIHNTKYYIFVIKRGLETLKHCFKIIYLYTKNAELAVFYCKKAFCYYIEYLFNQCPCVHCVLTQQLASEHLNLHVNAYLHPST